MWDTSDAYYALTLTILWLNANSIFLKKLSWIFSRICL